MEKLNLKEEELTEEQIIMNQRFLYLQNCSHDSISI